MLAFRSRVRLIFFEAAFGKVNLPRLQFSENLSLLMNNNLLQGFGSILDLKIWLNASAGSTLLVIKYI